MWAPISGSPREEREADHEVEPPNERHLRRAKASAAAGVIERASLLDAWMPDRPVDLQLVAVVLHAQPADVSARHGPPQLIRPLD